MNRAFWRQNTLTFNKPAPLGAKILWVLHWKCSSPFYSWSAFWIGSAYLYLYISFHFRLNKPLTNLTSLHQHHLQYIINTLAYCGIKLTKDAKIIVHVVEQSAFRCHYCKTFFSSSLTFRASKLECLSLFPSLIFEGTARDRPFKRITEICFNIILLTIIRIA